MSPFLCGPAGGVPAGYARCFAGTQLLRGHSPANAPDWFGPAVGAKGSNRFDIPIRASETDPGVCYLALTLEGVLLERVVRDVRRPALSLATLNGHHALSTAVPNRDLVLVDLLGTGWTVHGVQSQDIAVPPPYLTTQRLARQLAGLRLTIPPATMAARPDGILYPSRFGGVHACIALWDGARSALDWGETKQFAHDVTTLATACNQLGIGLLP